MGMSRIARLVSSALALVFLLTVIIPVTVLASDKGRKNTAIGLGAAAGYSLIKGHTGTGLVLAAGSAYAYKRYKDKKHHRRPTRRTHKYTYHSHKRVYHRAHR